MDLQSASWRMNSLTDMQGALTRSTTPLIPFVMTLLMGRRERMEPCTWKQSSTKGEAHIGWVTLSRRSTLHVNPAALFQLHYSQD